ncbi:hypothetical protein Tco_1244875 [Tanacetum coccineum]
MWALGWWCIWLVGESYEGLVGNGRDGIVSCGQLSPNRGKLDSPMNTNRTMRCFCQYRIVVMLWGRYSKQSGNIREISDPCWTSIGISSGLHLIVFLSRSAFGSVIWKHNQHTLALKLNWQKWCLSGSLGPMARNLESGGAEERPPRMGPLVCRVAQGTRDHRLSVILCLIDPQMDWGSLLVYVDPDSSESGHRLYLKINR